MHSFFTELNLIVINVINEIGYLGIFIGMFIESTPFPLPSELIMIPAGMSAAQGSMNLYFVLFCGVLGNLSGAIFSYYLAISVGRTILFRVGKYFFLKPASIIKIEEFFNKYGSISVFLGRMIIGLRHVISIPAGIAKMNFLLFCFYTFIGSTIWTAILVFLGYFIGSNPELIEKYLHLILFAVIIFCVLFFIFIYKKLRAT